MSGGYHTWSKFNAHRWSNLNARRHFHGQREKMANFGNRHLTLAHADLSGFSLFEEAQYRGVLAAERTLSLLGK